MSIAKTSPALTSGRLLAHNTIWNLLGQLLPMIAAVAAVPVLVRSLGLERFGVLSLAWIVIGYFSLFDLGIGRALTKLVADKLGANEEHSVPSLVWTSLLLMLLLGLLGALVALAGSPWLVHTALKLPTSLHQETLKSFLLLALSIPMVTVASGLRGILEAQQRFRILNLIRIPASIFSFAGPLLVIPFSSSLVSVIAVLVLGRLIGLIAHLLACFHTMPGLRHNFALDRAIIAPVIKFGGWMTVSNITSPLMTYLDRFLVATALSIGAVAYYTAPFDLVTRLLVVPVAVAGVLFPAFAVSLVQSSDRTRVLFTRGVKYIFLVVFPFVLITTTVAAEGLRLWLGPAFAQNSTTVLRWLAVGTLANSIAQVPFALVQGAGRPDMVAKLHLLELPLYLAAVWVLTRQLGIEGTAIAWTARATLDAILLLSCSLRLLDFDLSRSLPKMGLATIMTLVVLYLAAHLESFAIKAIFLVVGILVFALASWYWGLGPGERLFVTKVQTETPIKIPN